jgi:hypothetical protein
MPLLALVAAVWLALSAVLGLSWARLHRHRPRLWPKLQPVRRREESESVEDLAG